MNQAYNLLLAPHPDDLVFSAFSVLSRPNARNIACVFFNVSKFTRWPFKSVKIVTAYRTLEDRLILGFAGVKKVTYFFGKDSSVTEANDSTIFNLSGFSMPSKIFSPAGVGEDPNHIAVRETAISTWKLWGKLPELFFYEDLPYAAKLIDCEEIEKSILTDLSKKCGRKIEEKICPLSQTELFRKTSLSKAYFSQTNYSDLLGKYAKLKGRNSATGFAEIFFRVEPS